MKDPTPVTASADDRNTDHHKTVSLAIDTGGTFTDVCVIDRASGRQWSVKTPSTPDDPSRGFIDGIRKALREAGVRPEQVSHVFHGTTVATNAILEMRGADCALLTTRGFKHVLEIGRHDIPRSENMFSWVKPRRPIPPERIYEVGGRTDPDGQVVEPLVEDDVRVAARRIRAKGIVSIAVCYLHAYADSTLERRTREIVLEEHPEALVSLSSEVLPTFREFERSMTTALNAYVMPLIASYVGRLEARLTEAEIDARLLLVKSSGGVTGVETVRRVPVNTALSGPAAGVVGAQQVGNLAGESRLITLDIGGTSADICLIEGERPTITTEGKVGGWPVHLPMIAIHTIGAGGGSIARVMHGGLIVGPASAGADPGPACYGRGGTEVTVTDAHLVLGHLPARLLQGAMTLDVDAATRAVERVAKALGTGVQETARGVIDIANNNMLGAIRVVSVERGHDPAEFALVPFGGAGPLHGGFIARLLGMKSIIVGTTPGVLSSRGMLISDLKNEFSRTLLLRPPGYDIERLFAVASELEAQGRSWLSAEGMPTEGQEIALFAALRYQGQGFELDVPWAATTIDADALALTIERFHATHLRTYSFDQKDAIVELTGLRVEATGRLSKPAVVELAAGEPAEAARTGTQRVWFDGEWRQGAVYDRGRLGAGAVIRGPAIIEQMDATTYVLPGQRAVVDRFGALVIREE
jgi:N-methylhydantoinase A